jgi:hypothetical protein
LFGENGKPFLILDEDDLNDVIEASFDPDILAGNINVSESGIPEDMLHRIGDIKGALINFSRGSEFKQDFNAAMQDQFGSTDRPDSENEWILFQDRFVLEHTLESDDTVVEKFIDRYNKTMSEDVRQLVLGWEFVIEGICEVKDRKGSCGLSFAEKYEKDNGRPYRFPKMELPGEMSKSRDVGMLCDPDEGLLFLVGYRRFIDVFANPDTHLYELDNGGIVMEYLVSESISDVPFRHIAKKYPENFTEVISYFGAQEGFSFKDIEDLMGVFKPLSYHKLPTTVAVLDPELSKAARFLR